MPDKNIMQGSETKELDAFRGEVRAFLAEELPNELSDYARKATSVFHHPDISLAWQRILHKRGWVAPDWPEEFGGPGWSEMQRYIYAEECARAHTPHLAPMGLKMVAPVIMHFGTPEQRAYYLPRILSGEDYWCQGFSESGSGSDLASLSLRATPDGSDYVLDGSKIWTTHAQFATHMFALVRTSNEGKPQTGITFLLIDMKSAGIRVDPIITLSGDHELNQVFFDDVRVPQTNRLGEENAGWGVAKYLLGHERGGKYAPSLFARLEAIRAEAGNVDPAMSDRMAMLAIEMEALQAMELKAMAANGSASPVWPSALKILGTEISHRLDDLALDIVGSDALLKTEEPADFRSSILPHYLNNRAATIYAGSNEIQRDIIAKLLLG